MLKNIILLLIAYVISRVLFLNLTANLSSALFKNTLEFIIFAGIYAAFLFIFSSRRKHAKQ